MKQNIHPQYYKDAKITCACGASFVAGSTEQAIHVEICSMCHPYYTGKEKLLDTAGRVDKFRQRMAAAESYKQQDKPANKVKPQKEEKSAPESQPEDNK